MSDEVTLWFKDYKEQKTNEVAPIAIKKLVSLVAIDLILQHITPRYFQKSRHYGLHSASTFKRIKDTLPEGIKNTDKIIRTIFQLIKVMLGIDVSVCSVCGHEGGFDKEEILPDKDLFRKGSSPTTE